MNIDTEKLKHVLVELETCRDQIAEDGYQSEALETTIFLLTEIANARRVKDIWAALDPQLR